jgi:hypothetical protein
MRVHGRDCLFVILTMVIERFFVLIEEAESGRAADHHRKRGCLHHRLRNYQLGTASAHFLPLSRTLAAVAGVQVLLGRYTGYRLSELFRFRAVEAS